MTYKIVITLRKCVECSKPYNRQLEYVANELREQLENSSITISGNREHIKSIEVIKE